MKEEDSNLQETLGDALIEARIVAWVLGDASAFEISELERLCAERPELGKFRRRMLTLHGLLGEAEAPQSNAAWKLPSAKREKIEALFDVVDPELVAVMMKPKRSFQPWLRQVLMASAACLVLAGGFYAVMLPMKEHHVARAESPVSVPNIILPKEESRAIVAAPMARAEGYASASPVLPELADSKYQAGGRKNLFKSRALGGGMGGAAFDQSDGEERALAMQSNESKLAPNAPAPADTRKARIRPEKGVNGMSMGAIASAQPSDKAQAGPVSEAAMPSPPLAALRSGDVVVSRTNIDAVLNNPDRASQTRIESESSAEGQAAARKDQPVESIRRSLSLGEVAYHLGKYDEAQREFENALRIDPYNTAARRYLDRVTTARTDYSRVANDHTRAELLAEVDQVWELGTPVEPSVSEATTDHGQAVPLPADEVLAVEEPFSTFSLHVSDASFKLAKTALDRGERLSADQIRVEEFYNAFDYGDAAPWPGEAVACTIEQGAHPILPQRNLVRVAMRVGSAGRTEGQPLNLTVLVDNSGSMEREDRSAGLKAAIAQLASLLKAGDAVTLAGFSRTSHLLVDRLPGDQAEKLMSLVDHLPSEGGTNLEEALKLAGELAVQRKNAAAQNRIVLLTDGAANLGNADPEKLANQISELRQQGIAFDAAGIGAGGLNDRMLEALTRNGNGRYYIVNDPADADANFAKQLAGAFRPAAENVKVQVRFNPERVARYKLIGFEKHRLNQEDFHNDAVDAAEMAADEAGVALYQVEVLPGGSGEIGEVSVRFRDVGAGAMVERSWAIPHEEKTSAFDQTSPSMQLAGLSMLAAEKLKGGPLADATDFSSLESSVAKIRSYYGRSNRVSELIGMIGKLR